MYEIYCVSHVHKDINIFWYSELYMYTTLLRNCHNFTTLQSNVLEIILSMCEDVNLQNIMCVGKSKTCYVRATHVNVIIVTRV